MEQTVDALLNLFFYNCTSPASLDDQTECIKRIVSTLLTLSEEAAADLRAVLATNPDALAASLSDVRSRAPYMSEADFWRYFSTEAASAATALLHPASDNYCKTLLKYCHSFLNKKFIQK